MANATRLIKKYPNRRLYDTQTSAYITLADVKQLVLDTEDFKVIDAKSDEDLTRSILLQIILEEEASGAPLFSSQMLSQIIRFYGHAMQGMMGAHLEKTMQAFIEIQNKFQEQSKAFYDGKNLPNPELWTQFMQVQAPMIQGMMSHYIDQSKNLFVQMQDQMQQQARSVFQSFPFGGPGAPGGGMPGAADKGGSDKGGSDKPSGSRGTGDKGTGEKGTGERVSGEKGSGDRK
jgi:polyhydroxyalkanoate synthesis repressor PhaR